MHNFLKRLAGFGLGPLVGAVISVVQVPIMTRLLAKGDYGIYSFYKALLMQLPAFLCIGMDQAYVREYHVVKEKKKVFRQALYFPLITAFFFLLMSCFFSKALSNWAFGREDQGGLIILGAVWTFFGVLERFLFLLIRMEERAFDYSKTAIAIKISIFVSSVLILLAGLRNYKGAIYGLILGNLLIDLLMVYKYREYFDYRKFTIDKELTGRMLKYAFPLILLVAISAGLNTIDNLAIHRYATEEDLGIYNAGLNMVSLFSLVTGSFANFWVPTALRWHESGKSMEHFSFIADALLLCMSLIFFLVILGSYLIKYILGGAYIAAGPILGLLSMRPILSILSETSVLGMMFERKTHYNLIVSLVTFVPGLILTMLLSSRLGYMGAAIASALSYFVFYIARTFYSARSGFIISQKKQTLVLPLLFFAALIWAMGLKNKEIYLLIIAPVAFLLQLGTLKDIREIRAGRGGWDFN